MAMVYLKRGKEESLLRFHPWVFSGAIARVVPSANAPVEGDIVAVYSSDKQALGVGHYSPDGSITVRILEFGVESLSEHFFEDRIQAAYEMRQGLGLIRRDNNSYRLIHGEGDFLPGLIVDIYDDTAVMQSHSVGMHRERERIAKCLMDIVHGLKNVYYKSEGTLPHKLNIPDLKDGYLIGNQTTCEALENGLCFGIDWLKGQKTGFFLDQRENRALLERYSKDKDVLNMFCYTGGFSVYALRGGARKVHSVDCSQIAIDLVNENVRRNFADTDKHEAFCDDAFLFLGENKHQYDLIILDPPAFAKHRGAMKNALQGYKRLNRKAFEQIRPGGILFTFSCSQVVDKAAFRLAVFTAAAEAHRRVRILHFLSQPQDHPISIYHPEGEYLKGLVLWVE